MNINRLNNNKQITGEKIMIKQVLNKLSGGQELSTAEISELIRAINDDKISPVQIAGFQMGLMMKGPTLNEISAIAQAMRDNCVALKPKVSEDLMDTCGTGGGLSTFNISTAVAIVAAAAGIPVAKHGSRSISSLSGSADVLEALGVNINLTPAAAERMIEEIGISFLYAPLFHPVMCKVLPPETELGIKTIFYTIIGPLINPAGARLHLMGLYALNCSIPSARWPSISVTSARCSCTGWTALTRFPCLAQRASMSLRTARSRSMK
jgi:anthranilate phosphoribosyltransferase